jgi:hypothetical protein
MTLGPFEVAGLTFHPSGEVSYADVRGMRVTVPQGTKFAHLRVPPMTWSRGSGGVLTGVSDTGETVRARFASGEWWVDRLPARERRTEPTKPAKTAVLYRRSDLPLPQGTHSGERDGARYYKNGYCEIAGIGVPLETQDATASNGIRVIRKGNNLWCFDADGKVRLILRRWRSDVFGAEYKWAVFIPEVYRPAPTPRGSFLWYAKIIGSYLLKGLVYCFIAYVCLAFWPVIFWAPGMIDEWAGDHVLYESDAPELS